MAIIAWKTKWEEQLNLHLAVSEFNFRLIKWLSLLQQPAWQCQINTWILKSSKVINTHKNHLGCFHVIIECIVWQTIILWKLWIVWLESLLHCQMLAQSLHWVTCVYSVFSYCCGKQVVFFSHSRRLLKQRAFSVNLSVSAVTQLTAGWRAGSDVGKNTV